MDSKTQILGSGNDGVLDQILLYMGRSCKMENESFSNMNISNNNNIRLLSGNNTAISEGLHERFMHLPRLDSPTIPPVAINSPSFDQDRSFKSCYQSYDEMLTENEPSSTNQGNGTFDISSVHDNKSGQLNDWVTLDRLVASQLNGQVETSKQLSCFTDPNESFGLSPDDDMQLSHLHPHRSNQANSQVYSSENDLWSFTKSSSPSSSDPLCHLSV